MTEHDTTDPDPDPSGEEPRVVDVAATTVATIGATVATADLVDFFDRAFSTLMATVTSQGVGIVGPAHARYRGPLGDTVELEVGFPTDRAVSAEGEVRPGSLPAGRAAHVVHRGAYDALATSWNELHRWIEDAGLQPTPVIWEVYVTEPSPEMDPATLRTELFWLLEPAVDGE